MKRIIKLLAFSVASKRLLNYAILTLLVISQSSCFQHFYQTNTADKVDKIMLIQLDAEKKYFIVHTPDDVFALTNLKVDSETISGDRNLLNKRYDKYLRPEVGKSNRFPRKEAGTVFSEVHLYSKGTIDENGRVKLTINQIFRVDIYGADKAADKRSKTLSIIGIATVPIVAACVFAIAVSSLENSLVSISIPLH